MSVKRNRVFVRNYRFSMWGRVQEAHAGKPKPRKAVLP